MAPHRRPDQYSGPSRPSSSSRDPYINGGRREDRTRRGDGHPYPDRRHEDRSEARDRGETFPQRYQDNRDDRYPSSSRRPDAGEREQKNVHRGYHHDMPQDPPVEIIYRQHIYNAIAKRSLETYEYKGPWPYPPFPDPRPDKERMPSDADGRLATRRDLFDTEIPYRPFIRRDLGLTKESGCSRWGAPDMNDMWRPTHGGRFNPNYLTALGKWFEGELKRLLRWMTITNGYRCIYPDGHFGRLQNISAAWDCLSKPGTYQEHASAWMEIRRKGAQAQAFRLLERFHCLDLVAFYAGVKLPRYPRNYEYAGTIFDRMHDVPPYRPSYIEEYTRYGCPSWTIDVSSTRLCKDKDGFPLFDEDEEAAMQLKLQRMVTRGTAIIASVDEWVEGRDLSDAAELDESPSDSVPGMSLLPYPGMIGEAAPKGTEDDILWEMVGQPLSDIMNANTTLDTSIEENLPQIHEISLELQKFFGKDVWSGEPHAKVKEQIDFTGRKKYFWTERRMDPTWMPRPPIFDRALRERLWAPPSGSKDLVDKA